MTQKKKSQWENIVSPLAPWKFINLGKQDEKYKHYGVDIVLSPENPKHQAFIDKIVAMTKALFDKMIVNISIDRDEYMPKKLIKAEYTRSEDGSKNPTGRMVLKVKSKDLKPVFDATGKNKVAADTLLKLWSGTEGKVGIALKPSVDEDRKRIGYIAYLNNAKIVNPKFASAGSFFDDDDSDCEGGWTVEDEGQSETFESETSEGSADDETKGDF